MGIMSSSLTFASFITIAHSLRYKLCYKAVHILILTTVWMGTGIPGIVPDLVSDYLKVPMTMFIPIFACGISAILNDRYGCQQYQEVAEEIQNDGQEIVKSLKTV
ncbi:hypothetical protein C8J56DRAFT_495943 [Mycena floridula]|nr:hypothetical protein C8J56DRAFT_495943 [Mycena floridula]